CFWCLEAVYAELRGVVKVESGYAGGEVTNPTYRQVCSGTTGHVEVVQITFDSAVIAFGDLLNVFFTIHDPTTLNRQGGDVGTQYRSVIFYHNEAQRQQVQSIIRELAESEVWKNPIVTAIEPLDTFYRAEDYHQEYYSRNPGQPYCQAVIAPKVAKLRKMYIDKLKRTEKKK
ncbi:MAG: peptide-methionine (S)-S-oxide reductase MsrA, partial [bacterium]